MNGQDVKFGSRSL